MNTSPPTSDATVANPVLIVFGIAPHRRRPQAAWFGPEDAGVARWAAWRSQLTLLPVDAAALRDLGGTVLQWQRNASGQVLLPVIKPAVFDRLQALRAALGNDESTAEAATEPDAAALPMTNPAKAHRKPATTLWDALTTGHLVLGFEPEDDGSSGGWWEAVILAVHGDSYTLCWRDFPEHGLAIRQRHQIALLPPEA